MAKTKNSMSSKKTSTKSSSGGGLKVTTDSQGKITGGYDSTGSFSVDSSGKGTRNSGSSSSSPTSSPTVSSGAGAAITSGGALGGKPAAGVKSPVTTSDSARSTYDAMRDRIAKMANNTGNYSAVYNNPLYQETSGMIKDQRKSLADRKTAEIGRITADFGQRAEGQAQTQRSETGTQSMSLARIGGFDSASGQAVLTNLQRVHESEQNALMQARQSAILQAQQAYEDKDFELAKLQMDEAKATEAMLYNRQQDFLRNTLSINQEERAQTQMEYGMQRDKVADQRWAMDWANQNGINAAFFLVGQTAFDSSTGEALTLEQYQERTGQQVGAPAENTDFSKIQRLDQAREAKFIKEAEQTAVLNMQSKYVDAGILPTDSLAQAEAKLKNSRIYQEQVRPPSSGGNGSISTAQKGAMLAAAKQALADSRGSGDQKYDPNVYLSLRQDYAAITGETATFDNTYSAGLSASERANLGIGKAQGIDLQPNDGSSINPFTGQPY